MCGYHINSTRASTLDLETSRNGKFINFTGSLFQWLITPSVKKNVYCISNWNLSVKLKSHFISGISSRQRFMYSAMKPMFKLCLYGILASSQSDETYQSETKAYVIPFPSPTLWLICKKSGLPSCMKNMDPCVWTTRKSELCGIIFSQEVDYMQSKSFSVLR